MGRIRVRNMTRPVSGAHVRQVLDREIIDRTEGRRDAGTQMTAGLSRLVPLYAQATRQSIRIAEE